MNNPIQKFVQLVFRMNKAYCMEGNSQTHEENTSSGKRWDINAAFILKAQFSDRSKHNREADLPRARLESHGQFVGDGHEHFEDGHEGRDLAEVAAGHHLRVNLQTLLIVTGSHAAADLVEAAEDAGRELRGGKHTKG